MKRQLQAILKPWGQEHLLEFWEQLNPGGQGRLKQQIEAIGTRGFEQLAELYERYETGADHEEIRRLAKRAKSPPAFRLGKSNGDLTPTRAREAGEAAISAGEVGVILVAGGQGSRLGFPYPKGMYPIGPVSGRSLFQVHVEKIVARAKRHGRGDGRPTRIPLYVMTSPDTHDATEAFFAAYDRFGLADEDFKVFCQGTMPIVDKQGKVLLERPDRIATSPDGHGGMVATLAGNGLLEEMPQEMRHLFYLQVDNPLVDVCLPELIGYHALSGSEFTSQVIAKRGPDEKVGNVVEVDQRLMVIEYSDLPYDVAQERNPDGSLAIWAGSIGVHVIDREFLKQRAEQVLQETAKENEVLPFHFAQKKAAYAGPQGQTIKPQEPNAVKFERFIFDLMPHADHAILVEVDRQKAFAPLKNAPGEEEDTPEAVKAQMVHLHMQWLRRAGIDVAEGAVVEIRPQVALDADELARKLGATARR